MMGDAKVPKFPAYMKKLSIIQERAKRAQNYEIEHRKLFEVLK